MFSSGPSPALRPGKLSPSPEAPPAASADGAFALFLPMFVVINVDHVLKFRQKQPPLSRNRPALALSSALIEREDVYYAHLQSLTRVHTTLGELGRVDGYPALLASGR